MNKIVYTSFRSHVVHRSAAALSALIIISTLWRAACDPIAVIVKNSLGSDPIPHFKELFESLDESCPEKPYFIALIFLCQANLILFGRCCDYSSEAETKLAASLRRRFKGVLHLYK